MGSRKVGDTWYRVEDYMVASTLDEYETPMGPGHVELRVLKFQIVKVTPKGVRLDVEKVVLDHWNKKYACPTLELAVESFMARKRRQIAINNSRVKNAKEAILLAQHLLDKQITADNRHATT